MRVRKIAKTRDPGSAETCSMATGCNSAASSCDDMPQKLKQAVYETIHELIEQDPLYETLLDENIGVVEDLQTVNAPDHAYLAMKTDTIILIADSFSMQVVFGSYFASLNKLTIMVNICV